MDQVGVREEQVHVHLLIQEDMLTASGDESIIYHKVEIASCIRGTDLSRPSAPGAPHNYLVPNPNPKPLPPPQTGPPPLLSPPSRLLRYARSLDCLPPPSYPYVPCCGWVGVEPMRALILLRGIYVLFVDRWLWVAL